MKKYKVLVTARSFCASSDDARKYLEENDCEVIKLTKGTQTIGEQLEQELPTAHAVIAGLDVYDKSLISKTTNLKVISRYGVGYDKVDLEAAKQKGIAVTFTPNANGESVADMAMTLMLSSARNVAFMDKCLKEKHSQRPIGTEMYGKTVGIIGAGRIGKGVARRCSGFGMNILCYDIYEDEAFKKEVGAKYVDFETIIKESDFITIHTNLTEQTRNMFSTQQFKAMKKRAIIVNTARGGIIDEQALYEALKSHEIAAAGLDVTADEPPYQNPLLSLPNCTITPHAGAATHEASDRMSMMASKNVIDILTTGTSEFTVNK